MNPKQIKINLDKLYPNAVCELYFNNDYELALSVMLSAQSTDKRVNMTMKPIYKKYKTLKELDDLTLDKLKKLISSIGLYKTKARYFKEITKNILKVGYVPNDRKFLENIPGLGRKSVNVLLNVLYNEPFIAVDTHVSRVSKRLGIASENDDVKKIEDKLYDYFKGVDITNIGLKMVLFGRYLCISRSPNCGECPFQKNCPSSRIK